MAKWKYPTPVVTPECRLSFPHLFTPTTTPSGKQQYETTMLFPKENKDDLAKVKAMVQKCAKDNFSDEDIALPNFKWPWKDGDVPNDAGKIPEGHAGCIIMKAQSQRDKPGVVDAAREMVIDPSVVYGGCYAYVQVGAYPWEYMGKKGVSLSLINVQIDTTKKADKFGGSNIPADQAFAPIESGLVDGDDDPLLSSEDTSGDMLL